MCGWEIVISKSTVCGGERPFVLTRSSFAFSFLSRRRIGTYNGHQGAVWDMDCNKSSSRLLTASADATCKLWNTETGDELKVSGAWCLWGTRG